jgi:nucleoside phosphorylase
MLLLTMAHKEEANVFIERKHMLPVEFSFPGLYRGEDELLLLTGEGVTSTLKKVNTVCEYFGKKIDRVINLGIAGSLRSDLQINQIYGIRKIFYEPYLQNPEKTYNTGNERAVFDCITSFQTIKSNDYARQLAMFAQIVDRELWANAHICKSFNLPFSAYKLISDQAGDQTDLEAIRQNASEYSLHLFDFYKKLQL